MAVGLKVMGRGVNKSVFMKHLNKQRESELLLLPPPLSGDLFTVSLVLGSLLRVEGNLAQFKQLTLNS